MRRSSPLLDAAALAAVALALVAALACGGGPGAPAPDSAPVPAPAPESKLRTFERDGELWLERAGEQPQRLADDGRGYVAHVSPDGRWVAIDVVLFSNLQVTRLMRRDDASGRFVPAANLSTAAWTAAKETLGIGIDEVENARSSFAGWSEAGDAARIELSGLAPDGSEIRRTEPVPLRD